MTRPKKHIAVMLTIIGGALVLALVIAMTNRDEKPASWTAAAEGFLAVATPCCTEASLWDTVDRVTPDGQRARPASAAEAAQWLNDWPYRSREDLDSPDDEPLTEALRSSEVRCIGSPTGGEIPQRGDDEETLKATRHRRECGYAKWKVWSGETADRHLNERHTVWADEDGLFHGRVDYWQ
ncbi:MAG: hypothetical protein JRE45_11535 [Deltaproteobacteria bacterium]|nr:hypothetical protein [Deltaproteobacteria bacterium]MBW2551625.1 hypothetical protein [Deltaproteobacteria bacterium]MBW2628245.1 hypothetical protein [Deltaproteobacteria bacterium]